MVTETGYVQNLKLVLDFGQLALCLLMSVAFAVIGYIFRNRARARTTCSFIALSFMLLAIIFLVVKSVHNGRTSFRSQVVVGNEEGRNS
jgi:hypothetical protein